MSDNPALGKPIGSGGIADIFAYGADVLKLYRLQLRRHLARRVQPNRACRNFSTSAAQRSGSMSQILCGSPL